MSIHAEARHQAVVSELCKRYVSAGYQVEQEPELPELASLPYRPDLVARRNGQAVIIEVKVAPGQTLDGPRWSKIAETIDAIPGWRFVLAVAFEETMSEVELPSSENIRQRIQQARNMNDAPPEAALLYAWSIFEAAARLVFFKQGAPPERLASSASIVDSLVFRGVLSQEAGRELHALARTRNHLAHGMFSATTSKDAVDTLLLRAEELLNEAA